MHVTIRYIDLNDAHQFGLKRQIGTDLIFPEELCLLADTIYPNRTPVLTSYTSAQLARRPLVERRTYRKFNCVSTGLLMRSVVCCVVCACHLPLSVSIAGLPSNGWKGSRVHQSSLPVHSLSVDKPFMEPSSWRCTVTEHLTTSGWSTWVSEEPPACGFALMSINRPQLWVNSAAPLWLPFWRKG